MLTTCGPSPSRDRPRPGTLRTSCWSRSQRPSSPHQAPAGRPRTGWSLALRPPCSRERQIRIIISYLNCLVFILQLGDSPVLVTHEGDSFCISLVSQTPKHFFHILIYFPSSVFSPKYSLASYDLTKTHAGAINFSDNF